jgi:hypothetical protein
MLARRGPQEQSARAELVAHDTLTRVIQDGQEELRHRVGLRPVISQWFEDASGGLVVAAQDCPDTVLCRGLRRGRHGGQREHD